MRLINRSRGYLFSIISFLLLWNISANCQEVTSGSEIPRLWIDGGLGLGFEPGINIVYGGEARYRYNYFISSIHYIKSSELDFPYIPLSRPRQSTTSIAILSGFSADFKMKGLLFPLFPFLLFFNKHVYDYTVSASLGVGAVYTLLRKDVYHTPIGGPPVYTDEKTLAVGYPVEVEITEMFSPKIGYCHRFYANFNRTKTLYGFMITVQVGLL